MVHTSIQINYIFSIYGIVGLIGLLFSSWIINAARQAYFTPLRKIPGPWYARFTQLWLKYQTNTGRRMFYIESMHQRYGSVVRIAPKEIDVSDRDGYKEINRMGSGFVKSDWYPVFRSGVVHNFRKLDLFGLVDPKEHSKRRKMYAQNFSYNSIIQNWEPYIKARAGASVAKIRDEARQGSSDVFNWWHLLANEIMGKIAFGEDFGLIESGKENETLKYIHKGAILGVLRVEWGMLHKLMERLNLPMFREHFEAPVKFFQHAQKAALNARSSNLQSANIFSAILAAQEKDSETISDDVITIEAEGMMTGGSATTKTNMTYLIYEVLRRPEFRDRLENEVAQLPPDYTNTDLEALPFLNAVLCETLRCHAGAPGSLRRTAPRDGATLGGLFVPGGTTVGTQAYSLNRDAHIYPKPDTFDPSRFLDPETFPARKAALATFGGGSRICIGIHLAYIENRHITAAFFRECRGARLAEGTNEESMRAMEYFGMEPHSLKCEITMQG